MKQAETSVQPKRQKLLNVKLGPKLADDEVKLSEVKLPKVVMMMGSTEAKISEIAVAAEAAPEVLDDFDVGVNEEVRYTLLKVVCATARADTTCRKISSDNNVYLPRYVPSAQNRST